MNDLVEIRTVLGKKKIDSSVKILAHEHICCYSAYLSVMSQNYLDKDALIERSVAILQAMKERYGVGLFVDCTPVNIGRDIPLLKKISVLSGVDIVCASGFYYNDEPILDCMSDATLADFMVEDANTVCAGIIKAAVEYEEISGFNSKLLKASAMAQKKTGLPVVLHTNARNKNGARAVEILLEEDVAPQKIVVGHLSDTDDMAYIERSAKMGCYIAFDRLYDDRSEAYIRAKVRQIHALCEAGCEDRILLSHDDAVFMGFSDRPQIKEPRWSYMFDYIVPQLDENIASKVLRENPRAMLCGR